MKTEVIMEAKGKILVVDDSDSMRFVLREEFEKSVFGVVEAENLEGALTQMNALNGELSGVVSDLRMEGENAGVWVVKTARRHNKNIPVVLFTSTPELLEACEFMIIEKMGVFIRQKEGIGVIRDIVEIFDSSIRG